MCVLVPHPILDYTLFMLSPQHNHIILNIDVIIRLHFFFRFNSSSPPPPLHLQFSIIQTVDLILT